MRKKLTNAQIIYKALVWAEESMAEMVHGCGGNEYGQEVEADMKQLRAYRKKRFGERADPMKGAKPINVFGRQE